MSVRSALEALLRRMHPSVTAEMKLDLIERLVWLLDDNGSELFRVRREWLRSSEPELVEIALLSWSGRVSENRNEAEDLLLPLLGSPELVGRVEERLAELGE